MTAKRCVVAVVCALFAASAVAQCISALVPVSQPVIFPNHVAGPVVWSGSSFGVAKTSIDAQASNAIYFSTYDTSLNATGSDRLVASTSLAGPKLLLWNGTEFALFYQTAISQIVMQRLDAAGNLIGGPVAIAPAHPQYPGQDFDAAWDPSRKAYIVLHTYSVGFDRGLWLAVVGADGTTKSDDVLTYLTAEPPSPRVAVTATGSIGIVWSRLVNDQQELAFAVVAPGQPILGVTTLIKNASNPRMGTDNRVFFIVYSAPVPPGPTTVLRSAKIDVTGKVVASDALLLSAGQDVVAFSVIANPTIGEWALMYVNYALGVQSPFGEETRLRRIPFSGAKISDAPLSVDLLLTALLPQSQLLWNGSSYVASIGRVISRTEGSESYLARVCPLLVTATASATGALPNVPVSFSAQAAGGAPDYTYSWSFGDISPDVSGQRVTHAYPHLGTYTATVTATDRNGSVTTATVTVTVANLKRRAAGH